MDIDNNTERAIIAAILATVAGIIIGIILYRLSGTSKDLPHSKNTSDDKYTSLGGGKKNKKNKKK